jgi:hypothetical protein
MGDVFQELWGNASIAKLAYSVILLALIALLSRELLTVWWDPQLYVRGFKYYKNGQPDEGRAESFGSTLLTKHSALRAELEDERRQRTEVENGSVEVLRVWPMLTETISLPPVAKPLELKINGFDIGGLLSTLRGWISPPNEVAVTIQTRSFKGSGDEVERIDTDVTWPRAPKFAKDGPSQLQHFNIWGAESDEEAAALLAASLIWADAAKRSAELRDVGRDAFSDWAFAWLEPRIINYEGGTADTLNDGQKQRLVAAGKRLEPLLKRDKVYPEVWRLAADLVTLYPESIPGGNANEYRRAYFGALGIDDPLKIAEQETEAIRGPLSPGDRVFNGDKTAAVRVTAVVADGDGKLFLIFPALVVGENRKAMDIYASVSDVEPVAKITRKISVGGLPAVALAELTPGSQASNGTITTIGARPDVGQTVTIIPGNKSGNVAKVDVKFGSLGDGLVEVAPKITQPGDAGAPIVDDRNRLVAMGYAGSEEASLLVPLQHLLDQEKLTLAPQF